VRAMKITLPALMLLLVLLFVGWSMALSPQPQPFPFAPPAPSPIAPAVNRPVVRWVARTAKSLLWVMAFAEEKPKIVEEKKHGAVDTSAKLAGLKTDADVAAGEKQKIDWSEGW